MTKRTRYPQDSVGNFAIGELIPLKNCFLRVAHIEEGVVVLALAGFTKRGEEIIDELKTKYQQELIKNQTKDGQDGTEAQSNEINT